MKYYITQEGREFLEESKLKKAAGAAALTAALFGGGKLAKSEPIKPFATATTSEKPSRVSGGKYGKPGQKSAFGGPYSSLRSKKKDSK